VDETPTDDVVTDRTPGAPEAPGTPGAVTTGAVATPAGADVDPADTEVDA
jgi:hypothetical protein